MTEKHESFLKVFASCVAILVGTFGAVAPLVMVARSDGRIDYCYSHASMTAGQAYEVIGHRPWRSDAAVGYAPTPEAAAKIIQESPVCAGKAQ